MSNVAKSKKSKPGSKPVDARHTRPTWVRWLRRIGIAFIAITIAGAIAGEIFLRMRYGLGSPLLYVDHPTIGYTAKPNQDMTRFGNHIVTNIYGMRSKPITPQKTNPDELRILLIGDSIIFGGNLTDHEDLPATILQHRLETLVKRPVVVATAACGGWSPTNMLAYVREYGLFDADVVVLILSTHDWRQNETARLSQDTSDSRYPRTKPLSALGEAYFRYLPTLLKLQQESNEHIAGFEKDTPTSEIEIQTTWDPEQTSESTVRELVQFVTKEHHTPLIVGLHQEWDELRTEPYPAYHEWQKLFQEMNIPTYEFAPKFIEWFQNGMSPYRDYIHPNNLGHDAIAMTLREPILEIVRKNSEPHPVNETPTTRAH